MLTVNKKKDGTKLTAEIVGRVDVMTAPLFENEVSSELEGVTELVLDLKQLDYISSAGLRVVVGLQKTMSAKKGTLTVCSPSESILDIFTATGLVDFLDIAD
jgi:anti-sigma B factor antagonist